mmetsp:Transcript_120103/g.268421  ORF Transcript_120103/g.268421 Transcript_120103/m.268421 type:complete len:90 (+) Transcript_120103:244-513(+)
MVKICALAVQMGLQWWKAASAAARCGWAVAARGALCPERSCRCSARAAGAFEGGRGPRRSHSGIVHNRSDAAGAVCEARVVCRGSSWRL